MPGGDQRHLQAHVGPTVGRRVGTQPRRDPSSRTPDPEWRRGHQIHRSARTLEGSLAGLPQEVPLDSAGPLDVWGLTRPLGLEETEPHIKGPLGPGGQRGPANANYLSIGEAGRIKSIRSAEVWLERSKGPGPPDQAGRELSWVTGCLAMAGGGLPTLRPPLSASHG